MKGNKLVNRLGIPALALASALTMSNAQAQGTQDLCNKIQAKPGNGYTVCLQDGENSKVAVFDGFNPSPEIRDRGLLSVFNPLDFGIRTDATNFRLAEKDRKDGGVTRYDSSNTQGLREGEEVLVSPTGLATWTDGGTQFQEGYVVTPEAGKKVVDMSFAKGASYDAAFAKMYGSPQVGFDTFSVLGIRAALIGAVAKMALKSHSATPAQTNNAPVVVPICPPGTIFSPLLNICV